MNHNRLMLPLIIAFVVLLLGGLVYLAASQQPGDEAGAVQPSPAPIGVPAGSTSGTPTSATSASPSSAPAASYTKDSMTATVVAGTIPFSSTFTLQLNANRLCSPITYTINFGDNTARDVQVPKEQCAKLFTTVLNHQYQRAGTFIATLTSKPQSGTGMTLTKITITAKEPVVSVGTKSASFSIVPSSGSYPLTVAFTLSAGDSQNSAFRYTAQFGDGTSEDFPLSASPKLTHVFTNPGTYVVTVMKRTQCTVNGCTGPAATVGTVNVTAY